MERGGGGAEDYRKAIDLLTPLATSAHPSARQELARALNNHGLLLKGEQRFAEAQAAIVRAIAIHEELTGGDPENREYGSELAVFTDNLAITLLEQGAPAEAVAPNTRAITFFEGLARPAPSLSS